MTTKFPKEFLLGNVEEMYINYSNKESLYVRFDKSYVFQFEGTIDHDSKPYFTLHDKDNLILYQNDMTYDFKDFNILLKGGQYTLVFKDYDIERKIGFSLVDSNGDIEYNFDFHNDHSGWNPRFLRFYNEYKCLFKDIM